MTTIETATLGGGCFWCLEAAFKELRGVSQVTSGYAGGHLPNPTYEQVCSDTTGHAEVVQIRFDPALLSYRDLLAVFFTIHDPTTLNRQGHDIGSQYRSVIFYHDEAQREVAEAVMVEVAPLWDDPLVTELLPLPTFYPAEDYHHNYFANNPAQPYCQLVVAPKVAKVRQRFAAKLRRLSDLRAGE
ncbi:MAG: peptide-methionine (S)-S-oxide reductase MsrA [Truepera sp.]|nr:peptide-methionine (S)-S-oxide reductase MsrA [Truepera sp.]